MLTHEEKNKIREEVLWREEVRREIEAASPKRKENAVMVFLNSAFFVSIVGAAIIAFAGYRWQDNMATHQKERERQQQLVDRADERERELQVKKLTLLSTAAEQIDSDITILYNMRLHTQLLLTLKGPKSKDEIGRSWQRVSEWNDYLTKSYLQRPKPMGLFAQIQSVFGDEVKVKVSKLSNAVRLLEERDDFTLEQIQNTYDEAKLLQPDLVNAMGKEIKDSIKEARGEATTKEAVMK